MRVLLDECLPRQLKRDLVGHESRTAPEMGWAGRENGDLLSLAVDRFDVFLTVDRNLSYQQNVDRFDIRVVVMVAQSNRLGDLQPLMHRVVEALTTALPRHVTKVGA